jgi:formylglycine-generating enzyme required for sulfatase activity
MGAYEYQFRPGDLNCDGAVDVFDIDPFVLALTSAIDEPPFAGYLAAYPDCDPRLADVNGDGLVNVFDIDPFVQLLTGGPLGACCMGDGCQVLQQAACMAAGGWLWLAGQGCEPDPCPPPEPPGMVLIPAGEFMMGDTFGEGSYETPVHAVYVDAFYMGRYEVTKGLWDSVRAWGLANGYAGLHAGAGKGPNHPVQMVSWFDCVKWCNARSEMEGRTPVYYTDADLTTVYRTGQLAPHVKWDANGYRLPTEAEWEKAARGGTPGHRFPWSDQDTIQHARCNYRSSASYSYDTSLTRGHHPCWGVGSQPYTSPVGFFDGSMQYKADWGWPGDATSYQTASGANGYGLYDVAGNVWEWCHDWYSDTYYGSSPYDNPTGRRAARTVFCAAAVGTTTRTCAAWRTATATTRTTGTAATGSGWPWTFRNPVHCFLLPFIPSEARDRFFWASSAEFVGEFRFG